MSVHRNNDFYYLLNEVDKELKTQLAEDETAQRLLTLPGVGPVTASLLATRLGDGKNCASSRDFAAATGRVPWQYSPGGKTTRVGITKRGDKTLRPTAAGAVCTGVYAAAGA